MIHISILYQVHFPFRLLQNIEQRSLCYTGGPCELGTLALLRTPGRIEVTGVWMETSIMGCEVQRPLCAHWAVSGNAGALPLPVQWASSLPCRLPTARSALG